MLNRVNSCVIWKRYKMFRVSFPVQPHPGGKNNVQFDYIIFTLCYLPQPHLPVMSSALSPETPPWRYITFESLTGTTTTITHNCCYISLNSSNMVKGSDVILILVSSLIPIPWLSPINFPFSYQIAILFPPAAVAMMTGCSCDLLINILLTMYVQATTIFCFID